MKDIVISILRRAKKLLVLLLLIPVLTAGIAYVFVSDAPISYQARTEMVLGSFENNYLTNGNYLKVFYTSENGLQKINEKYNLQLDIDKVISGLTITPTPERTVRFSYVGSNKEEVQETLTKVTEAILEEGTELFEEKVDALNDRAEIITGTDTETEPITKELALHDMDHENWNQRNNMLLHDVKVSESAGASPKDRVILGLLIGITLSLFIVVLPEFFREEKKEAA
ncbi:hypothetical protein [Bacillus sp. B15-48]|uniref:hypothetical protein n=1 Tax=Bacillus sp. B15-48 TaxID=1548601 RepID=UPI00193EE94F|nr:hypothetical protein [Bacillus sp. B15-48]MBM4760884.1 hypothetical protein [Bacillus sp. B15-48]